MNHQAQHSKLQEINALWSPLSDDEAQNLKGGFFRRIGKVARRVAPVLKKVAPIAGKIAG